MGLCGYAYGCPPTYRKILVDWLSALHFQAPSAEAQSGLERLFALQEEFEAELKRYEERLEEEREREQQEYYKQRQQLEQGD